MPAFLERLLFMDWSIRERRVTLYHLPRRPPLPNIAISTSTEMGSLPGTLEEHEDTKIGLMHKMFRLNLHALWYFSLRSWNQGKQL